LPDTLDEEAVLIIKDDGDGMTFDNCENKYLNVGWCRRGNNPTEHSLRKHRPILGRKGIGKFAGFGIARVIHVETVSKSTGEKTVFDLDVDKLRGDNYVEEGGEIEGLYFDPDEASRKNSGTTIILKRLSLQRNIPQSQFARGIARRFLLHQRVDDFKIYVDDESIPPDEDLSKVEFLFPRDYTDAERPAGLSIGRNEWGEEQLSDGRKVTWRIYFYKDTIDEEELQGISIFANGKMVQYPFFFNLSGGLGGQAGQAYMSGQLEADFVDELPIDPISPERQRINWDLPDTAPMLAWGQKRVKDLLRLWHDKKGEKRREQLEQKVATFSDRLEKLPTHENKIVKRVLTKLGGMTALSQEHYEEVGLAVLTSWEEGRLHDLIEVMAEKEELTEHDLLKILIEAEVLSALGVAEAAKTKLLTIANLKERLDKNQLEDAVRDYIANHPWLISPLWETFDVERSVNNIIQKVAKNAGLMDPEYAGRIDLVLSSGNQLLVLEFMKPGLKIDWDHMGRFERYVREIRKAIDSQTASRFRYVTGYIIADRASEEPAFIDKIQSLERDGMYATDWGGLLSDAKAQWNDFLHILAGRGGGDPRLKSLLEPDQRSTHPK